MISYIKGELAGVTEEKAIIEAGGIGYGIYMPGKDLAQLPGIGEQLKIHTYLNVREDAMQLFGFLTGDELEVFRLLITVNGIGPKGGLGILSALSADELRFAVMAGDVKAITAAPGIGKKTAERLILDLKDKLKMEDILERQPEEADLRSGTVGNDVQTEAVEALVSLGYGSAESLRAVREAVKENQETELGAEALLKIALKKML
ncbi:Holliday junction ATP-dependent DNA helicase RuvA [Mediterraneibacter butyricigenes]|uniref:Holliday junction branch migration complex subunit RuvA n=1 Tax=Mediterraneibacter butyricigenes TaxID=2316025 RepID=A0A391NYU3_9FIRM|nr:Holliday junction branch migration protein RuvA [Mediterraneibacter butyricigenes]GCA65690.1 Holliday junction ATP-dependent DNA helicase RuvA [Mediterraneibacter butyricigenes]